jgi:polyferredoxin
MTVHLVTWYVLKFHYVGSIGIEAMFSGLSRGIINAGLIYWLLAIFSVILFGRAFCGWFCWFGGYLDLVEWSIIDKLKIKIPRTLPLYISAIPFVALLAKIYGSLLVNWLDGLPPTFAFLLADTEPWGGQQTGISIIITAILYGPVLLYFFGRHAWCRYLCPIGALLKVFNGLSIGKIRLVSNACNACGRCNRVCDMHVDVLHNLKNYNQVRDLDCIRCLKCTDECPNEAIAFTFGPHKKISLSKDASFRAEKITLRRRKMSGFDIILVILWTGVTLFFTFTMRQGATGDKSYHGSWAVITDFSTIAAVAKSVQSFWCETPIHSRMNSR